MIENRFKQQDDRSKAIEQQDDNLNTMRSPQEWKMKSISPKHGQLTKQVSLREGSITQIESPASKDDQKVRLSNNKQAAEAELMNLNIQLTKCKNDLQKLENSRSKNIAAVKQKRDLEMKLTSLNRQILPLKNVLRNKKFRA